MTDNQSKKILIVDDDKAMANAMERALIAENRYAVKVAYDGLDAGQQIVDNGPDLVILDIRMPGVDGYKLLTAIRNDPSHKKLKILIVSAVLDMKNIENIRELGADDLLPKPFDNRELVAKVDRLIK
jgi:DNA-binding response OmpR family regulator